jgi:predicted SnoaL-like aldol condensation-catalyzing enzyme
MKVLREYFADIAIFKEELEGLRSAHEKGDYFKVIVVSPQLMEKIVFEIDKVGEEYMVRKMGEPDEDDLDVYRLYNKLLQEETIKARVAGYLIDFYENDHWESKFPKKEFKKYFTKLENVISCRNQLAHEFYKTSISDRRLKQASKEAMDVVELLSYHPSLYT